MSTTKTKNLKLTIDSSSTDSAKKNLEKIDAALANVPTDNAGNLLIKSKGNIAILPENTDVGGSATDGGVITFGEPSKPVDSVEFYADSVALGKEVVITDDSGSESLSITFSGEDANLDVNIIADVDIKLRGNLETTAAIKLTGPADVTLPVNGVLLSEDSTNVLTNKSIDAQDNTLTNIGVSSLAPGFVLPAANVDLVGQIDNADVSPTAAIDYSKLNMTGLIVNSDISNSAAIAKSKLNLTNAITNADISPSAAIPASKLDLSNSIVDASVSASAAIDRSKIAAGPVGQAVMNDPSTGLLVSVGALPRTAGGTGVAGSATFPTSGTVLTDTNNVTVSNKVISGANNSLDSIPKSAVLLSNAITNADVNTSAAIDYSKLDLADSIEDSDISSTAAIAGSKIDADFGNQPVVSNVGIDLPVGGWTTRLQAAQAGQTADVTFELPNAPGSPGQVLTDDGTGKWVYQTVSGSGTVTSVALSMPAEFSVAGSPITTTGTLAVSKAVQNQNKVFAGPITGADAVPTFRVLDADDIPTLPYAKVTIADGDLTIAKTSGLQAALDGKIDENAPITGATKTKITYDANGLVTAGADLTASDLPSAIDANQIADGSVSNTEYQYLSSVTGNIQDQLDDKQDVSEKGAALGYASLDAGGKVPVSQLPSSLMEYLGTWAASTNTPTLANGTGDAGDVYVASDAGSVDFGAGSKTFAPGDWVIYSGSVWEKSVNSNAVASVNGMTGTVVVNAINELTGDVTTSSATGSESKVTTIGAGVVDNGKIAAGVDAVKIADGSVTNTEFQYINSLTSNAQDQLDSKEPEIALPQGRLVLSDTTTGALTTLAGIAYDNAIGGLNLFTAHSMNGNTAGYTMQYITNNIEALQDSPNETVTGLNIFTNIDTADSGFDMGTAGRVAAVVDIGVEHHGTSDIGNIQTINTNMDMGNGTDPISIGNISGYTMNVNLHDGVTSAGFNPFSFSVNADAGATISQGSSVFSDNANIDCSSPNWTSANLSPNIAEMQNGSNYWGLFINPVIGALTGNAGATLISLNGSIPEVGTSGFTGIALNTQIADVSSNSVGVRLSPQVTAGSAEFTILDVNSYSMTGMTGVIQGLNINVQDNANPGTLALNVQGKTNVNSNILMADGGTQVYGNVIGGGITLPDGEDITGTDVIANNLAFGIDLGDATSTWTESSLVGLTSVGFVGQIAGDGATTGSMNFCLSGFQATHTGAVDKINNFHAAGIPTFNGGTVNEHVLFRGSAPFGDVATANWGVRIDAANYSNAFARNVLVGTTTETNASVGIEISSTAKALLNARMTTTQRDALTPVNGMQIYNTTTTQMECYQAGAWQPMGGTPAASSFKTDWVLGDGASKTIVHSLGTKDISVEIFDKTDGQTIGVDTVIRTDDNTLDLTASSAPGAAGWRVLIRKV